MNIQISSPVRTASTQGLRTTPRGSTAVPNENFNATPKDEWRPSAVEKVATRIAPAALATLGAAAGLVAGFASGPVALAGGAVALGLVGGSAGYFMAGLSGLGPTETQLNPVSTTLAMGGISAAVGAAAGWLGGPVVGLGAALLGAAGGLLGGVLVRTTAPNKASN